MSKTDLFRIIGDNESVENIWGAMKEIRAYSTFESAVRLGLTMNADSIPFERLMVFVWIKDLINERKT